MKISNKYLYLAFVGLLCLQTACSDDDDYEPAVPAAAGNMGAYIEDVEERMVVLTPEDQEFTVTLHRTQTANEAVLPITVVSKASGIEVPGSVHFDAGQESAPLVITFNGLKPEVISTLELKLEDAYIDPYTQRPNGSSTLRIDFYQSEWKVVEIKKDEESESVPPVWWWRSTTWWEPNPGTLYRLGSLHRYKIENFMGSGKDLSFSLELIQTGETYNTYAIVPESANTYYETFDDYTDWIFYDNEADDFITVYPDANNPTDAYPYLYCYDKILPGTSYYSSVYVYNKPQKDGTTVTGYFYFWLGDDYDKSVYDYLNFKW